MPKGTKESLNPVREVMGPGASPEEETRQLSGSTNSYYPDHSRHVHRLGMKGPAMASKSRRDSRREKAPGRSRGQVMEGLQAK